MDQLNAEEEQLLDKWLASEEAINIENSTKALKEVKQILEGFGWNMPGCNQGEWAYSMG